MDYCGIQRLKVFSPLPHFQYTPSHPIVFCC